MIVKVIPHDSTHAMELLAKLFSPKTLFNFKNRAKPLGETEGKLPTTNNSYKILVFLFSQPIASLAGSFALLCSFLSVLTRINRLFILSHRVSGHLC